MKSFLIHAGSATQFNELERVARLIESRGHQAKLIAAHLGGDEPYSAARKSAIAAGKGAVAVLRAARLDAREFLRSGRFDGLIVAEDGLGGNLPLLVEAKAAKVPIYIVPYEYSTRVQIERAILGSDWAVKRKDVPLLMSLALGRRWNFETEQGTYLRLPPRTALAYDLAGLRPPRIDTVHGGVADFLLSESDAMTQHYHREGVDSAGKVIVPTGSLAHDDLAAALKAAAPGSGKLRILCALSPDYPERRPQREYADIINGWVAAAREFGEVTLQGHPAAREKLKTIGLALDERDITDLIANCDVLVTSVSSVIRYALSAAKPVINYDWYRFRYPDYRKCSTVFHVEEESDLRNTLVRVAATTETIEKDAKWQAPTWGLLDGRARDRMSAALGLS